MKGRVLIIKVSVDLCVDCYITHLYVSDEGYRDPSQKV